MSVGTVFCRALISGGWEQTKTELKVITTSKIVRIFFIVCFFLTRTDYIPSCMQDMCVAFNPVIKGSETEKEKSKTM